MLKELRMRRGYSQAELAEKLGLGVRQLQKYEKQDYNPENMTLGVALKICELLSCTLQELLVPEKKGTVIEAYANYGVPGQDRKVIFSFIYPIEESEESKKVKIELPPGFQAVATDEKKMVITTPEGLCFPAMDIMGNYGEEPILIWQSSPRGRGRRRAKCKIIALEGGIENG